MSLEGAAQPVGDTWGASVGGDRREFLANLVLTFAGFLGLSGLAARFLQYLYPVVPPEEIVEVPAGRRDLVPAGGGIVLSLPTGQVALPGDAGPRRVPLQPEAARREDEGQCRRVVARPDLRQSWQGGSR